MIEVKKAQKNSSGESQFAKFEMIEVKKAQKNSSGESQFAKFEIKRVPYSSS